jgi:hypothetical protein
VGAATCTKIVLKKEIHLPHQHAATASWRKERKPIPPIIGAAEEEVTQNNQDDNAKDVLLKPRQPRFVLRGGAPRQPERTEQQQRPQTHEVEVAGPATMEPMVPLPLHQHEQLATGQSVRTPSVNSLPLDNIMLRIVTAVQQFRTELNGAVSEEEKMVAITKIVLNLIKQNDQ